METPDFREIARQLRQPEGEMGKNVAQRMNINNAPMYHSAFPALEMENGQHILEIGPGNGAFLPEILALAKDLRYTGCDFSPTMIEEANRINEEWVTTGRGKFVFAPAHQLPFPDFSFERVLAINTIYFWDKPETELEEIRRVLKPGGKLIIGIRPSAIMQNLPFTQYGFTLYDKEALKSLLERSGYRTVQIQENKEAAQEVNGQSLTLANVVAIAEKR